MRVDNSVHTFLQKWGTFSGLLSFNCFYFLIHMVFILYPPKGMNSAIGKHLNFIFFVLPRLNVIVIAIVFVFIGQRFDFVILQKDLTCKTTPARIRIKTTIVLYVYDCQRHTRDIWKYSDSQLPTHFLLSQNLS